MKIRRIGRLATVSLVTLLSLALLPAAATSATGDPDPEIAAALQRISDGTYTEGDIAFIQQFPDIAAQVPDPTQLTEPTRPEDTGVTAAAAAATSTTGRAALSAATNESCGWWVDVWFRRRSLTGSTIYVWHHYVQYCLVYGSRITRWQTRYDYVTSVNSGVYVRELIVNQQAGVGSYSAWSHLQRRLEYCIIHWGCYANVYPWSKIWVKASGTYVYQGHN